MKIRLVSIPVDDQAKAEAFYTDVVGFKKKHDVPIGEFRWLTVVSPDGPDELELVLEPNANPAAKTYQAALLEQGIPITAFESDDVEADYQRLKERGVAFTEPPKQAGTVKLAVFADTCGNLIQIYENEG
ncbi:MAG: VOC family protein [Myxococcota bacterium]